MKNRIRAAAAAATLAVAVVQATPSYAGSPSPWTKLDPGASTDIIAAPGLARGADGTLHVVFTQDTGGEESILHVPISASGTVGARSTVVSGWSALQSDPAVAVGPDGTYHVYAAGLQNTDSSNPLSAGNTYGFSSSDGTTWALDGTTTTPTVYSAKGAYSDYGNDTIMLPSGTTVSSYILNGDVHVSVGSSTDTGEATTLEWMLPAGVDGYDTTLATAPDGSVWMAWFELGSGDDGVYVREVYPTAGTTTKAPHSSAMYGGRVSAALPDSGEPTPLVATSSGLYSAYCTGYPTCGHIAVWKVGTPSPRLTVPAASGAQVALGAGPGGRLWLGWYDERTAGGVEIARTNAAVTRLGAIRSLSIPQEEPAYTLALDGATGPADVVINTGSSTSAPKQRGLLHARVLPGLSLTASPKALSHRRAGTVTVHVFDAGAAVSGARVKVAGDACHTGSAGSCTLHLHATRQPGKARVTAVAKGYAAASVTLRRR